MVSKCSGFLLIATIVMGSLFVLSGLLNGGLGDTAIAGEAILSSSCSDETDDGLDYTSAGTVLDGLSGEIYEDTCLFGGAVLEEFTCNFRGLTNNRYDCTNLGMVCSEGACVAGEEGNSAPEMESLEDQTVVEGETLEYQFSVTDPDGDEITVFQDHPPTGSELVDNEDGTYTFVYETELGWSGRSDRIAMYVFDEHDQWDSDTFWVEVLERGNNPPVIEYIDDQIIVSRDEAIELSVTEGDTLEFIVYWSDEDGDALGETMLDHLGLSTYDYVDNGDYSLTFTIPTEVGDAGGEYSPNLFVIDEYGDYDDQHISISVLEAE